MFLKIIGQLVPLALATGTTNEPLSPNTIEIIIPLHVSQSFTVFIANWILLKLIKLTVVSLASSKA